MTETNNKRNSNIKVSYWLRGEKEKTCSISFNGTHVHPIRMGLPVGSTPKKVSKRDTHLLPLFIQIAYFVFHGYKAGGRR
jgi:hypothetical protein